MTLQDASTALSSSRETSMPLLDDADFFHSCQLEIHEGVNAVFTSTKNSISEYSRAQIQRNSDDVEITISEDLADGQNTKLDASLKLLGEDDQKLLLPSDELEEDEIHIIETTIDAPQGGNHALQDYQMQLMLLEQQNKKRLLMARQEKNRTDILFDQMAAAREIKRRDQKSATKNEQVYASVNQIPSQDPKATQVTSKMPATVADTGADTGAVPATKRQKRGHQLQSSETDKSDAVNGSVLNAAKAGSVEVSDQCL